VHPVGLKATIAEAASSAVNSALGVVSGIWGSVANNIHVNYAASGTNGYIYSGTVPKCFVVSISVFDNRCCVCVCVCVFVYRIVATDWTFLAVDVLYPKCGCGECQHRCQC
jgi:hypothetical protein